MVLGKLRQKLENKKRVEDVSNNPSILIVEDDSDQLKMLVSLTAGEIKVILKDGSTPKDMREKLKSFDIITVSEMKSLEQAVDFNENVILALLDCNLPDRKGETAFDQFVKNDKQIITGQHKAVDVIARGLPETPITLISAKRRFQRTIAQFYKSNQDLKLEFISKDDSARIQESIKHHLRKYVGAY